MEQAQRLNNQLSWGEVSIVLIDDEGITRISREYLNHGDRTDVISFTYPPLPGSSLYSGEVLVNVQQAVREGISREGPQLELALYIAHGCHHLTGATDTTPALRRDMRRMEESWLRRAVAEGKIQKMIEDKA